MKMCEYFYTLLFMLYYSMLEQALVQIYNIELSMKKL